MNNIRLVNIPISLVKVPESYVKSRYNEKKLELLKKSIQAQGQIEPIVVCYSDGDYYLVDGLHRLLALRELGCKIVKAIIYDCRDLNDALLMNLIANYVKCPCDPISFLKVAKTLLDKFGPTNIARWTGQSDRYWRYIKDVLTYLPWDLIEKAVKEYGANITKLIYAAQIVKSCGEAYLQELYTDKFWKMSSRELREYLAKSRSVKIEKSEWLREKSSMKKVEKYSRQELIRIVTSYLMRQLDGLSCNTLTTICGIETEKCDENLLAKVKQEVKAVLETYLESLSSQTGQ